MAAADPSHILIYGGTGGIGSALARRLAAEGHRLHLVGRDADRLAGLAAATGATWTAGDVRDAALFERVSEEAGTTIDGLAYLVGTINLKPLGRIGAEEALDDFRVNALGAMLAVKAALPALKRSSAASVLLVSSIAARQGFSAHASVGMAKAAVEGLTLSLAAELAPRIRVNCIAPSLVRTPLAAPLTQSESMAAAIAQLHPMQRLGEAEDVASLAAFLLSPEAAWMTGQVIGVDGGRSTLRAKG
ncbi:SDR family NAD(P)-dependent oxidoreductase [Kaistia geumhonensis]|uniref:NAD(P)-dependent dehydrogenase (Short-subunit alcohol dehydrogenase family) n=1 Tax=Kaistia geumhonensis TaxID=410839 RepID=A0ABU0M777_9HYPH|nr:SDR family oxidoreductase [Kaistia geumhonensis]MCX5477973.1 SDR family NAD(P)-dependent oxidoreductase [Kaistia geumhonensis]MDQ0516814.1 NAD(P)-dependent dehydrogenase (short-subunit alcohol dehydrogenase family) [Kaistia geumhonensis]